MAAFRQGLSETGYVEGRNVAIEYRWAQNQYDRLPELAADLVRRQVAVIAATDAPSAIAAKAATTTIPIVFATGSDPVKARPRRQPQPAGRQCHRRQLLSMPAGREGLGLLHELLPGAVRIAVLVDPNFPNTEPFVSDVQAAASAIGKQIEVLNASTGREIDTVFATLAQKPVDALLVGPDPFFNNRREQLVALAALPSDACDLPLARVRRSRRPDELRNEHYRRISPGRRLRRPDSQGREARRPAGHAVDQVRVRDQPQDRQGTRP